MIGCAARGPLSAASSGACVELGRESLFLAGKAGGRSGADFRQQGCWSPHGMVAGGRAANRTGAQWTPGQHECWCAAGEGLFSARFEGGRIARGDAISADVLQQMVATSTTAAKTFLLILQQFCCEV